MDHGYTKRQCPHDRCLNHNPEFGKPEEEITDAKPSRLFKILTYFKYFCCKKKMKIQQVNSVQTCNACGRKKSDLHSYNYNLLCECCGYHDSANGIREIYDKIMLPLIALAGSSFMIFCSSISVNLAWLGYGSFAATILSIVGAIILHKADNRVYYQKA